MSTMDEGAREIRSFGEGEYPTKTYTCKFRHSKGGDVLISIGFKSAVFNEQGELIELKHPVKIFFRSRKFGPIENSWSNGMSIAIARALEAGYSAEKLARDLIGHSETEVALIEGKFYQGAVDAIGKCLLEAAVGREGMKCRDCGHDLDEAGHWQTCLAPKGGG